MMNITFTITASPELLAALTGIATALGGMVAQPQPEKPAKPEEQPTEAVKPEPEARTEPKPKKITEKPKAEQPKTETARQEISAEEIRSLAVGIKDKAAVKALLGQFGVSAISQVDPAARSDFLEALKTLKTVEMGAAS